MNNIVYIYGNDKRQYYIAKMLNEYGYTTINVPLSDYSENTSDYTAAEISDSEYLLLPVPVSEEIINSIAPFVHSETYIMSGSLPKDFIEICEAEHAHLFNYMMVPEVAIRNAVATAEGAICEAIKAVPYTLQGSKSLVIGYGRCGSVLCDKLSALKSHVSVLTRSSSGKAHAEADGYNIFSKNYSDFDFIFNTAPAPVITRDIIDLLKDDCVIIDIASAPGGTDFEYCKKKGITALLCPGLPAKYSPKTSAGIIFYECIKFLECNTPGIE